MSEKLTKIILITGEPGVGKTTLIKKLFERLKIGNFQSISGFYTEEVRDKQQQRIGFDVVDVNNQAKKLPLARVREYSSVNSNTAPKVGKYLVDIKSFESIALPNLNLTDSNAIYIIDEIGKMEMFSTLFEKATLELLQKINEFNFLILATVPVKSLKLSDKFKENPLSKIFEITVQNRNKIEDDILNFIKEVFSNFTKPK